MKDLVNALEKLSSKLEEDLEVLRKTKGDSNAIMWKKIEDGILDKLHNANDFQLNHIMTQYHFNYYHEFNGNRELIKQHLREKKLKLLNM